MHQRSGPGVSPVDPEQPLTEAEARLVLARAAERERALVAGTAPARLREAAVEAGISAAAFDAALAEVRGATARRQRRWGGWLTAAVGLALLIGVGTTAPWRRVVPAVPDAPVPATRAPASDPTASATGPEARRSAVATTCATPVGVPAERLRTLATDLYPEVVTPRNRHRALVVALLFDAECNLKAHVLTRRGAQDNTVDEVLGPVFPTAHRAAFQVAGIADVGPWTFEKDAPWIVWGMERGPE